MHIIDYNSYIYSFTCLIGTGYLGPFTRYLVLLYGHMPYHNDTINKQTQKDFFRKIFTSQFICKGSNGLCGVLLWEGAGDRT